MTILDQVNPIDGLLDYIKEVKPYHTKIVQVLTEYVHSDDVTVLVSENFTMSVSLNYNDQGSFATQTSTRQLGGYGGVTPFGAADPRAWPVISYSIGALGPFDDQYPGYDDDNDTLIIPGDRTTQYNAGASIEVIVYDNNTMNVLDTNTYVVLSAEYVTPSSTQETPHTLLTVSNLRTKSAILNNNSGLSDSDLYATISLTPFDLDSVVHGYGGATPLQYDDVPPSGAPSPDPFVQIQNSSPDESLFDDNPVRVNSFVIASDVSNIFVAGSIVQLTTSDQIYHVLYSVVDDDKTYVRVIQTIPQSIDPTAQVKIRERIPGYNEVFSQQTDTDGAIATVITDSLAFSWSDPGSNDVIYGYQYLIQNNVTSQINVNGFDVDTVVSVNDTVKIIDNSDINGIYTVTGVDSSSITVTPTPPSNSTGGFIELYTGAS